MNHINQATGIVLAGGLGLRARSETNAAPKQLQLINGRPLMDYTLGNVMAADSVTDLIVVANRDLWSAIEQLPILSEAIKPWSITEAGSSGFMSRKRGLFAARERADYVAFVDAVRPTVSSRSIDSVVAAAEPGLPAIAVVEFRETPILVSSNSMFHEVPLRSTIVIGTAPQVASVELLLELFNEKELTGNENDIAEMLCRTNRPFRTVLVDDYNLKVTVQDDFHLASAILGASVDRAPKSLDDRTADDKETLLPHP